MGKWQKMTKEELETQYSPSRWSPRLDKDAVIEAHVQVMSAGTHNAQAATQTLLNIPYGSSEGEKLDVYLPKVHTETFPLVLYIHGGYWQFLSKDNSGFAAGPLVNHGVALAAVGYDVAPKGQLEEMVGQVRRCVAFAVQQYTGISGIYLLGHSAGAHLAAMVLSTDWTEFGVTPDIKGAILVSGVYDLEPIIHTYVNDALHMSREVALKNSPLRCVPKVESKGTCKVLIAVAQHDSPEFHRQSQEYFEALCTAGWDTSLLDIEDTDHFDVIEKLSQEDYLLTQMAEAGFIHCPSENAPDVVQCFICFKELEGWEPEDNPTEEHRKHSPDCALLALEKDISELSLVEFMKLNKERLKNLAKKQVNQKINDLEQYAEHIRKQLGKLN